MSGGFKAAAVDVLTRNAGLRLRVRRGRTRVRHALYRWHARGAVDGRAIVFESFVARRYAGSPRALYEAMLVDPRFADSRFYWAFRDPSHAHAFAALADPRTTVVRYLSADYYRAYGRAKVWISNSTLAPELVPRDQLYVQTWHGTGIKKIGFDVVAATRSALNGKAEIEERYRVEAAKIDIFVTPAPFGTTVFASAFGLPESGPGSPFVEIGNPRNDALAAATPTDVAAARARLGIPDGVRTVLYAPTFRDDRYDARTGYVFDQPLDLDALEAALGPGNLLLLRAHYLVAAAVDMNRPFVRDVSAVEDVNDVLLAGDVLVTDYSSMCFDYLLLDRPMVFYMYDVDRYDSGLRGFYFPVADMPGPIVRTQDDLTAALLDPQLAVRDAPRRKEARQWMCPHDDGHVSARTLDLLHERRATV